MSAPACIHEMNTDGNGSVVSVKVCPYCRDAQHEGRALHYWLEVSGLRGRVREMPCPKCYAEKIGLAAGRDV